MSMIILNDEQQAIQAAAREFAEKEVLPRAVEIDKTREFPNDLYKRAGELGFLRTLTPEACGGLGLGNVECALISEEIAKALPGFAMMIQSGMTSPGMMLMFPNYAHLAEDAMNGDKRFCCSMTDPAGSTNYSEWSLFAKRDGDYWVLNGTKNFCTHNGCDVATVAGICDDDKVRLFAIPKGTPGFENTHQERTIGFGGAWIGSPSWKDCRVPVADAVDFEVRFGPGPFAGAYVGISAVALGCAEGAFKMAEDYLKVRSREGKPVMEKQAVAHRMAKNLTQLEAMRAMLYTTCQAMDAGTMKPEEANMTKVFVTYGAVEVCREMVQIYGGLGVCEDTGIGRYFRDSIQPTLADYTMESHYQTVAYFKGWQKDFGV